MKALALLIVAACGDNRSLPIDAAIDSPSGTPDLALIGSLMDPSIELTTDIFDASACEVVEGCIDAPGTRHLLRFDVITANRGTADLYLGPTPPAGVSDGIFVWSACHMHHHVMGYADFTLRDMNDQIVISGRKQAFCLEDDIQATPGGPSHGYRCNFQGITVGWADVYDRAQACQWIDVTSVTPGTYTLRVEIDPNNEFPDADRSNNVWSHTVSF
ncbi:MAG: lysyl oxidase family protein [Kofleriaceae bacterium]